ncbi:hypothetical protein [Cohnella herbarum]|uniref:ABC-2 family transporter protein n=1 Tax=Cohnella herbarum TaxID=2728023 RepID=A0A7Z2ZP64_9BACL|nr:hypothetical protein [Cohnella herbarum]QJD86824.1 hypothetical protein HH215_29060 [Cohnella herbarum]
MTERKAVSYIGVYLWRRERFGMVFTLLFSVYLGFIISTTVDALLDSSEEVPKWLNVMADWIYLMMFPTFGMVMNKAAWGMWRDDFYSKRLAHWRSMPIPAASIVKARMLQSAIMLPVIGTVFMVLQYAVAPHLRESVSPLQWIENGIVWACYGLVLIAVYVWLELGFSGKWYCIYYFGIMFLMAVVSIVLTWQGIYLFQEVLGIILRGYGGVLIAGMAIAAGAALWLSHRMTINRIRARSMPL